MREIKFRWLHKKSGKITNWETVLLECDRLSFLLPCDDWIIMQYTGLKDKNGVEIYEGDICKVNSCENFEVIWRGIGFWFKRNDEQLFIFTPPDYWIEVIGNIYENPELLQGEKNES